MAEIAFASLGVDDGTWLARIGHALDAHGGDGHGCLASIYGPSARSIGFGATLGPGAPNGLDPLEVFEGTVEGPPDFTRHVYSQTMCDTTSGIGPTCEYLFQSRALDWGIRDAICVNAPSGPLRGAAFMILLPRRRRLRASERRWFADLSSILQIAARFRGTRRAPAGERKRSARGAELRMRDERRRLQSAGFDAVRELYEEGRRRVVVEPLRVEPAGVLSPREREAVVALRTLETNKEIAVLLGTSPSTVGVLLHRAAAKLGARSRDELVAIAKRHLRDS